MVITSGSFAFTPPLRSINRVFIHCSASDKPKHDDVAVIRKWHREQGWADIGYHYFITKQGVIQVGRDIEVVPAAQVNHNARTIAICLGGLNNFTEAQFDALRSMCHAIHDALPLVTFHGHREVNPGKTCPNFDYREVLGLNKRGELT